MIRLSFLVCLALARMLNASPQHSLIKQSIDSTIYAADIQAGVVVEKITRNSEGEKAGLQEGDILLGWSRGDSKGEIQSPFDLTAIEIEQAPLGGVKLEGRRGGESMAWSLGVTPWQISARPNFPSDLLSSYREAQELADDKAAGPAKATERWKLLASRSSGSQSPWVAAWLLF